MIDLFYSLMEERFQVVFFSQLKVSRLILYRLQFYWAYDLQIILIIILCFHFTSQFTNKQTYVYPDMDTKESIVFIYVVYLS